MFWDGAQWVLVADRQQYTLRQYGGCAGLGLTACLYLTANDGTLMSAEKAQRLPLHTFQSGPVNSLRGAAKLSGLSGVRAFIHSFHVYICCSGSGFSQNDNWLPSPVPESFSISLRCCCSTYTACGDRQAVTIKSHPDDHVNNGGTTHTVYHPACNHVSHCLHDSTKVWLVQLGSNTAMVTSHCIPQAVAVLHTDRQTGL